MKKGKLTDYEFHLMLDGVIQLGGTFTEGLDYKFESFYIETFREVQEFATWIDENTGGASRHNIQWLYEAFCNPDDLHLQERVRELKIQIDEMIPKKEKEKRMKIESIEKRNRRLKEAFSEMEGQIKILGNPNSPAIIYNDTIILSAHVSNFHLIFTDSPFQGKEVRRFKLLDEFKLDRETVMHFMKDYHHRRIYKIQFFQSSLFLTGWNFANRELKEGKYPVFSRINPKLYFTEKRAAEVVKELAEIHYDCSVV